MFSNRLHSQDTTKFLLGELGGYWNDASNWTNGIPDNNTVAVIPDTKLACISSTATAYSIVIPSGGELKLFSGGNLSVIHDIKVEGVLNHQGAKVAIGANLDISGNFVHEGDTVRLNGNLTIDGTFGVSNSSHVIFVGNTDAVISGKVDLKNMIVNKTGANIILHRNLTISNDCKFVSGNIITNGHNLIFEDGATATGFGSHSFVHGTVEKEGNDDFTFPIGTIENGTSYYAPIGIDNTSGATSDSYSAKYYNEAHSGHQYFDPANHTHMEAVSALEYWDVQQLSGTSTPKVTLHWDDGAESGITDPASLVVAHWDPSSSDTDKWENFSNTATDGNGGAGNSGSVTSGDATGFSTFTFGTTSDTDDNPLPVELLDFRVECHDNNALVSWATASELNNDHFDIQVAGEEGRFNTLLTVNGNGNSNELIRYQQEIELAGEVKYIRLSQTDFDGKQEIFKPVAVDCNCSMDDVNLYPNPVQDNLNITLPKEVSSGIKVEIYTISGTSVFSAIKHSEGQLLEISLPRHIPAGIYFVRITEGDTHIVKKIRKQ